MLKKKYFYKLFLETEDMKSIQELFSKKDKTLLEWIDLLMHPSYRFRSLYPDQFSVKDNLLCAIGTEYKWDTNGFIINDEHTDINQYVLPPLENLSFGAEKPPV